MARGLYWFPKASLAWMECKAGISQRFWMVSPFDSIDDMRRPDVVLSRRRRRVTADRKKRLTHLFPREAVVGT